MTEFAYKVVDQSGRSLKGSIKAVSEAEAVIKLEKTGQIPISLIPKVISSGAAWWSIGRKKKLGKQDLEFFSRQLATLLRAGIPVMEAFDALSHDAELGAFIAVLREMMDDIQDGSTLAEAMSRQKSIFSETYVRMVRAGETGGVVPETLEQIAQMLEEQRENMQIVKSATRYPLIVLATLVIVFFVLVGFVLPRISTLFAQFGTSLPLATKVMLQLHTFLKASWHFMLIGTAGVVAGIVYLLRIPKYQLWWDGFKTRLPVFGPIFTRIYMERFCTMMKVLLDAGVPIFNVLENVGSSIGNTFTKKEIAHLRASVHAGEPMAAYMRQSPAFPSLVTQMTGLGEKSGRLTELLDMCAKHYQREIKYKVKNLLSSIEPVMTLIIGIVIFFFMLSVFLPIWNTVKFLK